MTEQAKEIKEKLEKYRNNTTISIEEFLAANDKHLKGYMYDSLVYRYMRAREAMADYEWYRHAKSGKNTYTQEDYHQQAKRDIIRFCQILDEAIGEHD